MSPGSIFGSSSSSSCVLVPGPFKGWRSACLGVACGSQLWSKQGQYLCRLLDQLGHMHVQCFLFCILMLVCIVILVCKHQSSIPLGTAVRVTSSRGPSAVFSRATLASPVACSNLW